MSPAKLFTDKNGLDLKGATELFNFESMVIKGIDCITH